MSLPELRRLLRRFIPALRARLPAAVVQLDRAQAEPLMHGMIDRLLFTLKNR